MIRPFTCVTVSTATLLKYYCHVTVANRESARILNGTTSGNRSDTGFI